MVKSCHRVYVPSWCCRFSFKAWTHIHTQTHEVTDATDHLTHTSATAGVSITKCSHPLSSILQVITGAHYL